MANKERELLKKAYPGQRWIDKVNSMSDAQVIAVYFRLKKLGKI